MADFIKNSIIVIEKGIESLKTIKKDKQEYKEYQLRVKALPQEYKFVYEKITEYLWSYYGGGDGEDMIRIQAGLLELFEESVAEGKDVLAVTGEDVAAFSDELLRSAKTYADKTRAKLNETIQQKLSDSTHK